MTGTATTDPLKGLLGREDIDGQPEIPFTVRQQYKSKDCLLIDLFPQLSQRARVLCHGGGTFTEAIPAAVAA